MQLVKFSCDCIGFEPNQSGVAIIIKLCDRDWDSPEFGMGRRDMTCRSESCVECEGLGEWPDGAKCGHCHGRGTYRPDGGVKSHKPLSRDESEELIAKLIGLAQDGEQFRNIRSMLKDILH